ncbi:MAG: carbohydrate ABC transporter permease, partial [Clostridiales bacterium]|nr:carbohydrate ABC transporter permease [Clostridiales bacterium]
MQRRLIPSYIFLIFWSLISVFPFYWMISAATNNTVDVARGKLTFGTYALQNYQSLIGSQK